VRNYHSSERESSVTCRLCVAIAALVNNSPCT